MPIDQTRTHTPDEFIAAFGRTGGEKLLDCDSSSMRRPPSHCPTPAIVWFPPQGKRINHPAPGRRTPDLGKSRQREWTIPGIRSPDVAGRQSSAASIARPSVGRSSLRCQGTISFLSVSSCEFFYLPKFFFLGDLLHAAPAGRRQSKPRSQRPQLFPNLASQPRLWT